jgi:hypothetical protein
MSTSSITSSQSQSQTQSQSQSPSSSSSFFDSSFDSIETISNQYIVIYRPHVRSEQLLEVCQNLSKQYNLTIRHIYNSLSGMSFSYIETIESPLLNMLTKLNLSPFVQYVCPDRIVQTTQTTETTRAGETVPTGNKNQPT